MIDRRIEELREEIFYYSCSSNYSEAILPHLNDTIEEYNQLVSEYESKKKVGV